MPNLDRRFWLSHGVVPLLAFVALATLLAVTDIDLRIADRYFYDFDAGRWPGRDSTWARDLVHTGGRDAIRLVALATLICLGLSFVGDRRRHWRRPAAFVFTSLVLSMALVGTLKQLTNVDCPLDLERYGGTRPYVPVFADRPDGLPRAACFPGSHSSSGFALLCFYFLLRRRRPRAARAAFATALAVGAVFSLAQQARGAHFLSHDLWSAFLVWFICLGLYGLVWQGRVMSAAPGA